MVYLIILIENGGSTCHLRHKSLYYCWDNTYALRSDITAGISLWYA